MSATSPYAIRVIDLAIREHIRDLPALTDELNHLHGQTERTTARRDRTLESLEALRDTYKTMTGTEWTADGELTEWARA